MVDEVWILRHGETEWSKSGQHTGRTDLDLTRTGEVSARSLAPRLDSVPFDLALVSPLRRARRTAELAGVRTYELDPDLVEWDYGDYEGMTRVQILETRPDWSIWKDGGPGGESPPQVTDRVDRVIKKVRSRKGRVLVIAHGHILRCFAARWIDQTVRVGDHLPLETSKLSVLGFDRGTPTIESWNS